MIDHLPAVFDVLDPRFGVNGESRWSVHDDSGRWTEGPVWVPAARSLIWSDIPGDRLLRYDEASGTVAEFRRPSGFANGATIDAQGRLIHCQHGARQVVRTEHDGRPGVVADRYDGKRFNSPNDVVVASDGAVWFTDPDYGIAGVYEGHRAERELPGCGVYRVEPGGAPALVIDSLDKPNGLAFSLDGRTLYVSDTGARTMWSFAVSGATVVAGSGRLFATCQAGGYDGFRLDEYGRIWTSTGEGVHCYHPDGTLLAVLPLPQTVSNVCFGGARRNRLFVTATTSLCSIHLSVRGAPLPVDGADYAAGAPASP